MSFTSFWTEITKRIRESPSLRESVPSLAIFEGIRPTKPPQYSHMIFLSPIFEDFDEASFDYNSLPPGRMNAVNNRAKHSATRQIKFEVEVNDTDPHRQLVGSGQKRGLFQFVDDLRSVILRNWRCYSKTAQQLDIKQTVYAPGDQLVKATFVVELKEIEVIEDARLDPMHDPLRVPTEGSISGA